VKPFTSFLSKDSDGASGQRRPPPPRLRPPPPRLLLPRLLLPRLLLPLPRLIWLRLDLPRELEAVAWRDDL